MNLTGVLLEGSLKRDALGLLSFIGLSWILVPFQAYASLKALFEKKEGGWVRTPKSGRVTESLERFHLARLMPWELPRRKRGQSKPSSGTGRATAAAVVVLTAAGIITVGALSIRAAATSGITPETDLAVPALLGTMVPLLILALGWLRLRRRMTALILAFTLGLGTNVVFLAHAVPAAAVTDNSSVFTFANTTAYSWPSLDMKQHYTPSSSTATNCPGSAGYNWQCAWTSDMFTTGQTMNAGTAQSDLYLENNPGVLFSSASGNGANTNTCTMTKPSPIADGDVMLAACVFRGGTGTTVTSVPAGWNLVSSRIDNGTTISLIVYSHVVASAASEPASYVWNLGASVKLNWVIVDYLGVDTSTPIDVAAGQATPSSNDHAAPSVTPTAANGTLVTFHSAAMCSFFNPPPGMTERKESTFCTQANSSNDALEASDLSLGAIAPTGTQTASLSSGNGPAVGATMSVVLKASTVARTCNVSVQLSKPIRYRSSDSNIATNATSITINKPAGVVDGDVMVVSISFIGITFPSLPAGWTQVRVATNGGSGVAVFVKAASGEPASYTFGTSAASNLAAGISAYIGVHNVTPVDADNGGTLGNFTSVTTVTPATMLVVSSFKGNGAVPITWTPPTGMNERVDRVSAAATFVSVEQADALWAPAAASGNRIAVPSDATQPVAAATVALRPASALIGSATAAITSPLTTSLVSTSFATSAVTFATGDFLQFDVYAPNDSINCGSSLSYDSTGAPSKLTVATIVPEGVAGLLLLAPALPFGARWWKRRR
jgi:hypothetical protein